jgi:hypothetical protein
MKRNVWLLSVALMAVAAIEFGILGAGSAGATFVPSWLAASKSGPPSARQDETPCPSLGNACTPTHAPTPVSPPPCLPDRQHASDRACEQQPASIQLTPDPLTIHCDGVERSTLTVRVTDAQGEPVPDGTTVYFAAYNGTTMPPFAPTRGGVATTSVVFYADLFKSGPNLIVDVGPLEAGVRIRCFPNSDQQPPSPPLCPLFLPSSPPCLPPPLPTPTPCSRVTSPPSVSPPCATPTPFPTRVPPTPFPTPTPSIGGEISFGTPSLANGTLTVPILTTAAHDALDGFSVDLAFDGSLVSPVATGTGSVLESLGVQLLCLQALQPTNLIWSCSSTGDTSTTNEGTLAVATFVLKTSTGCARFHVVTLGPPDGGDTNTGTYTIDSTSSIPQRNTYGTDVTVNLADGIAGCIAPPLTPTPTATPGKVG